ncbi:hypothetical protein GCM10009789_45970 [Kribbella sancticallisti]|uniref:Uncharacterized protein n=1 Tax=Kribbella sancticallisti TaxID=460087 RepID=A0ABN2DWN5_9ACTN
MQAAVRDLHLGLDARGSHDPASGRLRPHIVEQRRFADAGFTTKDQRGALPGSQTGYKPIESLALVSPTL